MSQHTDLAAGREMRYKNVFVNMIFVIFIIIYKHCTISYILNTNSHSVHEVRAFEHCSSDQCQSIIFSDITKTGSLSGQCLVSICIIAALQQAVS